MTDNSKAKLIILTAGGTGGHVFPADALAQELSNRAYRLMLVTDKRGLNNYHGKLGEIENRAVSSGALVGKSNWFKLISLCKLAFGVLQSLWIILRNRPMCIIGFGGYASFPCCVAAVILGKPLIIHEQNSVMSRTNRFLAKYASIVATSFTDTKYAPADERTIRTGMPIRPTISNLFGKKYQPAENVFNLLVLGGSQGAKIFAEIIPQAVKLLDSATQSKLRIIQQCRQDDVKKLEEEYKNTACTATIAHFFENMPQLYSDCHLIISRAGASSVSEIAAAGIPSVLVPLPTAADNHQFFNAAEFEHNQGGIVIKQKELSAEKLAGILKDLINSPQKLNDFSANTKKFAVTDADKRLADLTEKIIKES